MSEVNKQRRENRAAWRANLGKANDAFTRILVAARVAGGSEQANSTRLQDIDFDLLRSHVDALEECKRTDVRLQREWSELVQAKE